MDPSRLSNDLNLRLIETESIFDALAQPTYAMNEYFQIVRLNRAALEHIGVTKFQDVLHKPCYQVIHRRDSICPFCPFHKGAGSIPVGFDTGMREATSLERIISHGKSESEKTSKLSFYRIIAGRIQIVESVEDITDLRQKQEETLRIENLASLGMMVSGITHELNNPMTGMGLTLQNLEANITSMEIPEVVKRLKLLKKDLSRASRIIEDILSFSRPGPLRLTRGDLLQVVNRARANTIRLYPVLSSRINWEMEEEEESEYIIQHNPEKIERLFINLFRNSIQAYDYSPGTIRVEFRRVKRWIHVIVEDSAGGISDENIQRIFNPFFSTREDRGTGLGLTIVHSIVKEHNGRIRVWSGGGVTRFYISLPVHSGYEPQENHGS